MTQLDPSIILQAGKAQGIDAAQLLEQRAQLQMRNAALAKAQREEAAAQKQTRTLGEIGSAYASGGTAAARPLAAQTGNFALIEQLDKMDDASRKRVAEISQATAPLLYSLKNVPPEQRVAALSKIAPDLKARGFTDPQLAQLVQDGVSDQTLDHIADSALTIEQHFARQDKALDRTLRADEADATRNFQRGNAYISAGLIPPDSGSAPARSPTGAGGGTQFGWTPRARHGGDNTDEAVDGKIAGMVAKLGVDPTAPLDGMTNMQIAEALALSEGGKGSIADRYNNPANLTDPKTGQFRRFPTKKAGLEAAAAQVARNRARGQNSIQTMVEGLPTGGGSGELRPIPGGKLDPNKPKDAPSGYRWSADGSALEPIPGGPGDKQGRQANLKPPPVRAMDGYLGNRRSLKKIVDAVSAVAAHPDAVGFWKGLTPNFVSSRTDPKGVSARALVSDIGSLKIHDRSGAAVTAAETPRLIPFIPQVGDEPQAIKDKLANFQTELEAMQADIEDAYSEGQGYKFPTFRGRSGGTLPAPAGAPVKVNTPEEARALKPGTVFITPDGRKKVR